MFKLDQKQIQQLNEWLSKMDEQALASEKAKMTPQDFEFNTQGGKYPYSGSIGGSVTYCFTPTSIGTVIKVKHELTGNVLDVTDYDMW